MAPFGDPSTNLYISCVAASGDAADGSWTGRLRAPAPSGLGRPSAFDVPTWRAITPVIGNIMGTITTSARRTVIIN